MLDSSFLEKHKLQKTRIQHVCAFLGSISFITFRNCLFQVVEFHV